MPSRPVQISLDRDLLRRIDADPEVRCHGRSAFMRAAVELYLRAKARRDIDEAILKAYSRDADKLLAEVEDLVEGQAWPES